jgi:hypothetical protein
MERLICHMAKPIANRWQNTHLPFRFDNGFNVRTNGRTNVDTNTGKRSSSNVRNAHEHEPKFLAGVSK